MSIDVVIVGGYLGSGKSSLINHLLSASDKAETGIIVNDLAPVNVDAEHVIRNSGITLGIQDGCVCCSVVDRLGDAFDRMTAFRPRLKRILVEASGVGDPYRISYYSRGIKDLNLRAIVTVVDATTFLERMDDRFVGSLVRRQVEAAGQLVINKTDAATSEQLSTVEETVRRINARASVVRARFGKIDAGDLYGRSSVRDLSRSPPPFPAADSADAALGEFKTMVLRTREPVDLTDVRAKLQSLAGKVERIKGVIVTTESGINQYLVQITGGDLQMTPADRPEAYRESALVFILKGDKDDVSCGQRLIERTFSGNGWQANTVVG